jgi:hypothetical protein
MGSVWPTLVEALACPCEHPSVIKFLTIHGLHIMVEWGHISKNVSLQHEVLICYGQSNVIVRRGPNMEGWKLLITFKWNCMKMAQAFMNMYIIVGFYAMTCHKATSCCIFHSTNLMLCTLVCAIGVKLDACKRWFHICMFLPRNKMQLTWRKHISGWR